MARVVRTLPSTGDRRSRTVPQQLLDSFSTRNAVATLLLKLAAYNGCVPGMPGQLTGRRPAYCYDKHIKHL